MIDPVRHRQAEEETLIGVCVRILANARNELYLNMRFLDLALSGLGFEADFSHRGVSTDGFVLYYHPSDLCAWYLEGRRKINRAYLHMILHCLFSQMDTRGARREDLWNLACDIAVESVIDGIYAGCIHKPLTPFRQDWYGRLRKKLQVLNGEGIYRVLESMELSQQQWNRLSEEFFVDDHERWKLPKEDWQLSIQRQNQWSDRREKLQTELETMGSGQEEDSRSLLEQVQVENRERYDYRKFLRRFCVWQEELELDDDAFDYGYYTYGLSLYGNLPLMEPLETKEVHRIAEFVIVIDTSMSCSGDLVRRFLEETYDVLCESDSYVRKTNIHVIQCDEQVQADTKITSREELEAYQREFTVIGQGGTDFRPAFLYVSQLIGRGELANLKGLLYFTDGEGIYPMKRPPYDTAFVFVKDQYTDISVPPWAMKVILEPEQIRESISDQADARALRQSVEA